MEGKALVSPSKTRRGSGGAIYEKYLNIKNSALPKDDEDAKKMAEISNSTDDQELEAGEVVSRHEKDAYAATQFGGPVRGSNDGRDVTFVRMEERGGSGGLLTGRSRSRSRSRGRNGNGMLSDMNGGGRAWPHGPPGNGRFDGSSSEYSGGARSPRGQFGRRPGSPGGRPGSPPCGGFDRRPGSPPRGGFYRRSDSPPRGGYNRRPDSPQRNGFGGGHSPPRGDFDGGRESPRRDGFNGPPSGPRGRSPPREDFRRSQSMSPGRGGPPRDFRDNLGPGRDSPRGRMMGGYGPCGPRRSRSRSPFSRGPPHGNGFGPLDRRSPPRNGFDDRGFGGRPPFEDRGPPNMFRPRGRSRSPNRPLPSEMMCKRDRSWERGGPPPNMVEQPFNGSLPDSPRIMEPRPFDTPSEWNFELKRSGKVKCRCSATSLSIAISRQLPLYLDVVALPHLRRSPEFLQLERPNIRRVVYELKPESLADANGYREFVDYLIQGRGGHARAGAATEMEPQGFKIFLLPPGQAARQIGYKGDHMVAVLRSR